MQAKGGGLVGISYGGNGNVSVVGSTLSNITNFNGGLVSIFGGRANGNISVIGSTLTNITVRAHCRVPSQYLSAPRLPSGGSAPLTRRAVPHGVGCEYPT